MDDEAKQLLREMRGLLAKADARDTEWMQEIRRQYDDSAQKSAKAARISAWTFRFLLAAFVAVVLLTTTAELLRHGIL
jgi:hypothetical protein